MGQGTPDLRATRTRPHITPDHQTVQRPTTGETRTVPPRTYHGSRQKQERHSRPLRCTGESLPSNMNHCLPGTQTNLSNFTGTTYRNISRSYVEFQRFYEQIVYSNPQTIIPALPLPQTAAPTDEEGTLYHSVYYSYTHSSSDDRLVRVMLQRWFTRVCEDPILLNDEEVRSFIESDFGVCVLARLRAPPSHDVLTVPANATQTPPNGFRVQPAESPPS